MAGQKSEIFGGCVVRYEWRHRVLAWLGLVMQTIQIGIVIVIEDAVALWRRIGMNILLTLAILYCRFNNITRCREFCK